MMSRLLVLLLVFSLAGCATMRQSSQKEIEIQQLQSRINELEKEVEQKDEQISTLQGELEKAYEVSSKNSSSISSVQAPAVHLTRKQIQVALKQAGFYKGAIDGKIGRGTKQAIMNFQKANNLTADGIVGKKTTEKLRAYLP